MHSSLGRRLLEFQRSHALGRVVHRTDVRAYAATRTPGKGVEAHVAFRDGHREDLPHLKHHNPFGFDMGHAGPGPADLARSIIGHFLEREDPESTLYQRFKVEWLACASARELFVITADELESWLETGTVSR